MPRRPRFTRRPRGRILPVAVALTLVSAVGAWAAIAGTRDTTFTPPTTNGEVYSIATQPDGKVLIGGDFTDLGGDPNTDRVGRLNANGTRDTTFTAPTPSSRVVSIATQPDGKVLIGGFFTDLGATRTPTASGA